MKYWCIENLLLYTITFKVNFCYLQQIDIESFFFLNIYPNKLLKQIFKKKKLS